MLQATLKEVALLGVVRQIEDRYEEEKDDVTEYLDAACVNHNLDEQQRNEVINLLYDRLRCKLG